MELSKIKGLGVAYLSLFNENNIINVEELIEYIPNNIHFYNNIEKIDDLYDGYLSIFGKIITSPLEENDKLMVKIYTDFCTVKCYFENTQYMKRRLILGKNLQFNGIYDTNSKTIQVDSVLKEKKSIYVEYKMKKINTLLIEKFINRSFEINDIKSSYLPNIVKARFGDIEHLEILKKLHSPESIIEFEESLNYFYYIKTFSFFICLYYFNFNNKKKKDLDFLNDDKIKSLNKIIYGTNNISESNNSLIERLKDEYNSTLILESNNVDSDIKTISLLISCKVLKKSQVLIISTNTQKYSRVKNILANVNISLKMNDYENFNRGSIDVLVINASDINNLNLSNTGLIIIDNKIIDIGSRIKFNKCLCDTIFISETNIKQHIDNDYIDIINMNNTKEDYIEDISLLTNINNCKLASEDLLKDSICNAQIDALKYIKDKMFLNSKIEYDFLKDNILKFIEYTKNNT